MFDLFVILGAIMFCVAPLLLIISTILTIRKKKPKKWWIAFVASFLLFLFFEIAAAIFACEHDYKLVEEFPATCTKEGYLKYHCNVCNRDKTEYVDELGHDMRIVNRVEPTQNLVGEIIRRCERCDYEEVETVAKLPKETETSSTEIKNEDEISTKEIKSEVEASKSAEAKTEEPILTIAFDEIYYDYKENELRAEDSYKNNRYRITAKVNEISTSGLFNMTGGAILTMEVRIDSTIVFFYAEFEKEQEDALKTISVGDTITFEGKCLNVGSWVECELIIE
ncbi:MAG: hypothetical protein IJX77_04480 [Ruminococcus sp.]|nr:hypothetical protein [Ruminococcus sp.]